MISRWIEWCAGNRFLVFTGTILLVLAGVWSLRRVPLGRLLLCTNVGLAAGLTARWLGGPWAWHHMGFLGFAGFSAGALLARA